MLRFFALLRMTLSSWFCKGLVVYGHKKETVPNRLGQSLKNFYGYIEKYEPKFAYYLYSSETVSFFLPLALLLFSTLRPFTLDILSRNPCLFFLFLTDG